MVISKAACNQWGVEVVFNIVFDQLQGMGGILTDNPVLVRTHNYPQMLETKVFSCDGFSDTGLWL